MPCAERTKTHSRTAHWIRAALHACSGGRWSEDVCCGFVGDDFLLFVRKCDFESFWSEGRRVKKLKKIKD